MTIAVFQALAYFDQGNYREATEIAISALEHCRQMWSRLHRDQIEVLYKQLLQTPFRDKPLLTHLGIKLLTWDHGMG